MIERIKRSFDAGAERVRWFFSLLGERLRVELAVIKLLNEASEMERKSDDLKRMIGHRVYESKDRHGSSLFREPEIVKALEELEELDARIEDVRKKASEIAKVEA